MFSANERVLRMPTGEAALLSSREKAPYIMCVEVLTHEGSPSNSAGNSRSSTAPGLPPIGPSPARPGSLSRLATGTMGVSSPGEAAPDLVGLPVMGGYGGEERLPVSSLPGSEFLVDPWAAAGQQQPTSFGGLVLGPGSPVALERPSAASSQASSSGGSFFSRFKNPFKRQARRPAFDGWCGVGSDSASSSSSLPSCCSASRRNDVVPSVAAAGGVPLVRSQSQMLTSPTSPIKLQPDRPLPSGDLFSSPISLHSSARFAPLNATAPAVMAARPPRPPSAPAIGQVEGLYQGAVLAATPSPSKSNGRHRSDAAVAAGSPSLLASPAHYHRSGSGTGASTSSSSSASPSLRLFGKSSPPAGHRPSAVSRVESAMKALRGEKPLVEVRLEVLDDPSDDEEVRGLGLGLRRPSHQTGRGCLTHPSVRRRRRASPGGSRLGLSAFALTPCPALPCAERVRRVRGGGRVGRGRQRAAGPRFDRKGSGLAAAAAGPGHQHTDPLCPR